MRTFSFLATLPALAACAALEPRAECTAKYDNGLSSDTIKGCVAQYPADELSSCCSVVYWAKQLNPQSTLDLKSFVTFNPSVKSDCSGLKTGKVYCIEVSTECKPTTFTTPTSAKGKPAPGPHYGDIANCGQWQKIFVDDIKELGPEGAVKEYEKHYGDLKALNPLLNAKAVKAEDYLCVKAADKADSC